ncbi:MAG: hypothetical protein HFF81_02975 [Oscillospiraceae bacterium]|jgi:hypothetical protein|nr:hypothetical protein [Oscillospiraceae bacterium]
MKKAAIFAAAAALALSLTACGGQENGTADQGVNGGVTNGSTSSDNGVNANDSARDGTRARSSVGSDVRRGLDSMGDAVEDMWDGGRRAVDDAARGAAGTTSFQQMLDNARVTDVDGNMDGSASGRW